MNTLPANLTPPPQPFIYLIYFINYILYFTCDSFLGFSAKIMMCKEPVLQPQC